MYLSTGLQLMKDYVFAESSGIPHSNLDALLKMKTRMFERFSQNIE